MRCGRGDAFDSMEWRRRRLCAEIRAPNTYGEQTEGGNVFGQGMGEMARGHRLARAGGSSLQVVRRPLHLRLGKPSILGLMR